MAVIGIDLGGTKLAGALFSDNGNVLARDVLPLEKRQGKEVEDLIGELIEKLRPSSGVVNAIGISVPGIANTREGTVWAPNISGWDFYPLVAGLEKRLPGIPIVMDSDRSCYILGECWKGKAQGCKDAIFMAVGTGIGAGILIEGKVLRGSADIAGAVGWLALSQPYRSEYDNCGDFEYHASGAGLAKVAMGMLRERTRYDGPLRLLGAKLNARHVFTAYETGDPIAEEILGQAIGYWGRAVANLVSIFNPEKIIFGGGVFGPAVRFLGRIHEEARRWAQPISFRQVSLEASVLGGEAGLIGAGYLALSSLDKE